MNQFSKLAKKIAYWTVPAGFRDLGRKLLEKQPASETPAESESIFSQNINFNNAHLNERCFILATGPTINKQDLRALKDEVCIACSMFFLHKDYKEIDPLYHVFVSNHAPHDDYLPQKYIGGLNSVRSKKTNVFFGDNNYEYSFRNFLNRNPEYKTDKMYFLNYHGVEILSEENCDRSDLWDLTKRLFLPVSVIASAIQIAVYTGFKSIYLLGCDYDYFTYMNNRTRSKHFYDDEKGIDDSVMNVSSEEHFYSFYLNWRQFRLMGEYANSKGCRIFNATEGGYLDVFPRVPLQEALARID